MDGAIIARVLHVLGVVLWIGGLAMVTTVLLPETKHMKTPTERVMFFETVERGFALQARVTVLVTGLSGLYLVYKFELWQRFAHIEFWWMHAMVLVWALFTLVTRLHWVLLGISLITVAGAVAGSHGFLRFSR